MTIQNYLKDVNYTISGNLSYGDLAFNYNSTSADLSDLEQYKFVFTKAKNTSDVYTVNNIFNANLYDTVLKMITGIKYTTKQTHISDIYNFYDYDGLRVIVPTATWYDFLVINDNKTISIVSKKHDYSIYILRDLIKSQLENNGGVLFHSAAITKDNNSILIIGNKGAGKSTFAFGMAAAFDYQLISNDRTYLGQNDLLTSFPIDIRLGKGTIDNNVKLKQMVDGSPKFTHEFASLQANGINYFDDRIRKIYPYNVDFFVNFTFDSIPLHVKFDEFFSHYIMHFLPKTHKKYNDAACAKFDNSGEPILLDNKNPFVELFYKGIYQSLKDNILTEQDAIHFLCTEDLPWLQHTLLMTHNNYDQTPWKYFNPQDSIPEPSKTLSKLSYYYNKIKSLEKKSV